jgi:hypothetical protein
MRSSQLKLFGFVFAFLALGIFVDVGHAAGDADQPDSEAAELSVEPTTAVPEGEQAITEESAEEAPTAAETPEEEAGPSLVQQSLTQNPLLWSVIGIALLVVVGKSGYGLLNKWATQASAGEVFGSLTMIGGLFTITNAAGLCFGWSLPIANMFVAGFVAMVFGIGIASSANEKRKEAAKK